MLRVSRRASMGVPTDADPVHRGVVMDVSAPSPSFSLLWHWKSREGFFGPTERENTTHFNAYVVSHTDVSAHMPTAFLFLS